MTNLESKLDELLASLEKSEDASPPADRIIDHPGK